MHTWASHVHEMLCTVHCRQLAPDSSLLLLLITSWHPALRSCREENSSGVLSSRLASDTVHVRGAVGDVFGLVALNGANLLFGFLIAYAYNWRMALVVTGLLPVVALAGFYQMKFSISAQGEVDGLYAGSNQAVTEGLSSIRVIHAYNLQVGCECCCSCHASCFGGLICVAASCLLLRTVRTAASAEPVCMRLLQHMCFGCHHASSLPSFHLMCCAAGSRVRHVRQVAGCRH